MIRGELADFPMLAELPARGPGADMIGRALGLLTAVSPEFSGQTTATGWRLSGQTTADLPRAMRRAVSWLGEDLDAAQSQWDGFAGAFKLSVAGPYTLAAAVELSSGERLISDAGAVRDLAGALGEAVRLHLADAARRLPDATLVLQIDEPSLPAALAGRIATQSGWSAHRPVSPSDAEQTLSLLADVITASAAVPAIHCCGQAPPHELMRATGAKLIAVDLTLAKVATGYADEQIGELLDTGGILVAGIAGTEPAGDRPDATARLLAPLLAILNRLSIQPGEAAAQIVLSPACGLAGAGSMSQVRAIIEDIARAGRALRDENPESDLEQR